MNACTFLNYPDKNKVFIHICDDKRRDDLKELSLKLKVNYITRPNNEHAKAGNLNNAFKKTSADLVVTLDADMIVHPNFLLKTVPFFLADEKMAFVQVPHHFYNPDTFQYNMFAEDSIPNEQDFFHTSIQNGRSKYNAVIYAGSNTVLSRSSLEATGGFETGTITEDIATGMKLQAKGYTSAFVNEVLAIGLAPFNIKDLFNQRIRWAVGAIQTLRKRSGYYSALNIKQKLIYFMSYSYWFNAYRRLIYLIVPMVFILFKTPIVLASMTQVLMFWLPMFLINNYTYKKLSQGIRSTTLNNLYETVFAPALAWNLFKEIIGFKQKTFKVTPKDSKKVFGHFNLYFFLPHLILFFLLVFSFTLGTIYFIKSSFAFVYGINIFWIGYNIYILFISLLYASERPIYRKTTRFNLKIKLEYDHDGQRLNYETSDISDDGFSIQSSTELAFKYKVEYQFKLNEDNLESEIVCELIRINHFNKSYLYGFRINSGSSMAKQSYDEIIYNHLIDQVQNKVKNYKRIKPLRIFLLRNRSIKLYQKMKLNLTLIFFGEDIEYHCEIIKLNHDLITLKTEFSKAPLMLVSDFNESLIHYYLVSKKSDNVFVYQVHSDDFSIFNQMIQVNQNRNIKTYN